MISKSMLSSYLKIATGGLVGFGVMSPEVQAAIIEHFDVVVGGGLALWGVLDGWIRNVTNGPLGKWWGAKQ